MMTTLISQKKDKIIETKRRGEVILNREEIENQLLDQILKTQGLINSVNDVYMDLFPELDEISRIKVSGEEESGVAKEIMDILYSFNTQVGRVFSKVLKNNVIAEGCKSALLDLRINIRNLREYLCDLEELFFLAEEDKEFKKSIGNLL